MLKNELIKQLEAIPSNYSVLIDVGDNEGARRILKVEEGEIFITEPNEDGDNGIPTIIITV